MKNTLAAWGITRTGSRVEAVFEQALARADVKKTEHGGQVYLWRKDQDPETYDIVRRSDENSKRAIEDICPEELGAAVALILKNAISIDRSELIKETAKIFGFSRSGDAIETAVSQGIARAVRRKKAKVDENGRIMLAE